MSDTPKAVLNFSKFLLKVTDHNGDIVDVVVEAENSNKAMTNFLLVYDGSINIRKIEASLPLLVI
jgi:hypothetical protein